MISGKTALIPQVGYSTEASTAPLIYNLWFQAHGIDLRREQRFAQNARPWRICTR